MEELLAELDRRGVRLAVDGEERLRVEGVPRALDDGLRAALQQHKRELIAWLRQRDAGSAAPATLAHDAAARFEPFPLTPLQRAYWLGRDPAIELGGVATHLYLEFACREPDAGRLEDALACLIERHDMLRAVVDGTGRQRVLAQVPRYRIAVADCQALAPDAAQAQALATREALSHQVLDPQRWPLFDIRATRMPGGELRLHLSLDLLAMDGSSIHLFMVEWRALLEGRPVPPPPAIGFRDVVLAREAQQQGAAHAAAWRYWEERLDTLPDPPQLPVMAEALSRRVPMRFGRRTWTLPAARWGALKPWASAAGITPSGLVLAACADVLARWSRSARFTITLTVGSRENLHPDIPRVLGDFTAVVLHEVDRSVAGETFGAFAARQQRRLVQDLQHRACDGMEVRREWARRRGLAGQPAMPVVFSSGLGWGGAEGWNLEQLGPCVHAVSQTSQVWLDCHATELHGQLVLAWDAVDGLFAPGVLDAMFQSFTGLVDQLAEVALGGGVLAGAALAVPPGGDAPAAGERAAGPLPAAVVPAAAQPAAALPPAMQARRDEAHRSTLALPRQPLHAALVQQALQRPARLALVSGGRSLCFGDWLAEAAALADQLLAAGTPPGQPVAIVMRKGWEQAVAALGVLLAGAAYVPIDADWPALRQRELLQACGARQVLLQPDGPLAALRDGPWHLTVLRPGGGVPFGELHARSLQGGADQPAYVIFTSGTTGAPKGVVITHHGATNTVLAINHLLGVGEGDVVLGLSSLAFDLSVYDLFGVPAAGGRLVLPEAGRAHDPLHWSELMQGQGVTLWNSAPQLMRMLLDVQRRGAPLPGALRAVLLSGDFMPLDTLDRLRSHGCGARLFSLGGATEASIWSVMHEVVGVDPAWTSIPYGRPLPNQQMWVLDGLLRPAPDHVPGRIFIGGCGLAQGYLGDPERTAQRFIRHPATGERLYDTGDIGRYADNGEIIILGREDGQVKIRGHRVELGEIEAVLQRHPAVDQACALATGRPGGARSIAVFVQPHEGAGASVLALQEHLAQHLPQALLPQRLSVVQRLPVSANGKVDRQALADLHDGEAPRALPPAQPPRSPSEAAVAAAWARVLPGVDVGLHDNFFDIGGDSVLAVELLRELNQALPVAVQMHELFEHLTIAALAQWVDAQVDPAAAAASAARGQALASPEQVAADVDFVCSTLAGVDAAAAPAAADAPGPRRVLLTGATGWVGAHLLAELLRSTPDEIVCLVRGADAEAVRHRLLGALQRVAPDLAPDALARVRALPGRMDAPAFDLPGDTWAGLCRSVEAIYHLAGSTDVARDYAGHRRNNVLPLVELLHLAGSGRRKVLNVLSPAAVCRRVVDGQARVLADAQVHAGPEGLRTAYAQSKWVAEQVLHAAAQRGLAVHIYRSSHALPAAATGLAPEGDTHVLALRTAAGAGVPPPWPGARLHGLPVDQLCSRLVADSIRRGAEASWRGAESTWQGAAGDAVIHLDSAQPPALADAVALLRSLAPDEEHAAAQGGQVAADAPHAPHAPDERDAPDADPLAAWLQRCRGVAAGLPPAQAALAMALFDRSGGLAPVELMFNPLGLAPSPLFPAEAPAGAATGSAAGSGTLDAPAYWQRVRAAIDRHAGADAPRS